MKTFRSLLKAFDGIRTPFYYYDTERLRATLDAIKESASRYGYHVHYAVKANANPKILAIIRAAGLGADCVSGGEIRAVSAAGFPSEAIVYAGVGKSDWEIDLGLDNDIACFNVESLAEMEVIEERAAAKGTTARIALRINPNVGAHTHANITTGLAENKFGIALDDMVPVAREAQRMDHVELIGLHFHIGSQILEMGDFIALAERVNSLQAILEDNGIRVRSINVGGGLGVDYQDPDGNPIPDFGKYFDTYHDNLRLRDGQVVHFELGRSVVAQCGSLITRTLYIKQGKEKQFAIVDAGMSDLIRPALYHAYHKIENISSDEAEEAYDVVGPICESSDVFGKQITLNKSHRGDLIAIRSAGAYGEIMASHYNCRQLPIGYTTEDITQITR